MTATSLNAALAQISSDVDLVRQNVVYLRKILKEVYNADGFMPVRLNLLGEIQWDTLDSRAVIRLVLKRKQWRIIREPQKEYAVVEIKSAANGAFTKAHIEEAARLIMAHIDERSAQVDPATARRIDWSPGQERVG